MVDRHRSNSFYSSLVKFLWALIVGAITVVHLILVKLLKMILS